MVPRRGRDGREPMPAVRGRPVINGFLNLYKPAGITSMDAVRRVKRATRQRRKVGHAGTLDPLAEGVLPICFGQATRLMEMVVSGWKRYRMTARLGAVSNTYDAEGDIEETGDPLLLTRADIAASLGNFVGEIEQLPPMYSAIKVDGRRLYDLARAGREIERSPRLVSVRSISIDEIRLPFVTLTVECGRGTYLRSIAHDLGQMLGCGAYVTDLARLSCGQFESADGITLDALEDAASSGDWTHHLHPVDWALRELPAVQVEAERAWAVRNGQTIPAGSTRFDRSSSPALWRIYGPDGVFLALARPEPSSRLAPARVFDLPNPSPYAPTAVAV